MVKKELTAGPWRVDAESSPIMVESVTETWPLVDEGVEVGRTGAFVCNAGDNLANAEFIAAAPAVRAALEKLLRAEEKYVRDTGLPQPDDFIQDAVNEARLLLGWPAAGVDVPLKGKQ